MAGMLFNNILYYNGICDKRGRPMYRQGGRSRSARAGRYGRY